MKTSAKKSNAGLDIPSHTFQSNRKNKKSFFLHKEPSEPFFGPASIQPKLEIGAKNDTYVKEADNIADQVKRMPEPTIQKFDDEKDELQGKPMIQRKLDGSQTASPEITRSIHSLKGSGQALPRKTQQEMGSKIGADFSEVRVHTGSNAIQLNRELEARAFTVDNDIFFNQGQYNPDSGEGKWLMAHELVHTVQQSGEKTAKTPVVQRMSIGTGNPPERWVRQYNARVVPQEDRSRVEEAISMIREVATNPDQYSSCHAFFRDNCPNGNEDSLVNTFINSVLWKGDRENANAFATVSGTNIAYTQAGYNNGARRLARTLTHELMHSCGIGGGDDHYLANVAGLYCIGTVNEISVSGGPALNADIPYYLFSYRRFLAELGNGQIQLVAGADLNILSIIAAIDNEAIGEIGSIMTGLHGRTNLLFGGERFGGLTGRIEPGISVGRFSVRDSETALSGGEFGPGFVLQAGFGAEFYIPIGVNAHPLSVEATYRLVVPLNQPAEAIHGILGNIGFKF